MNRKIFYFLTNTLYLMSPLVFKNHLKKHIFDTSWFKKAVKEKKIKIKFLSKKILKSSKKELF